MGSNTKKRRSAKRGILIALVVFLSIVLAVLLAATVFMTRLLGNITHVDPNQETMSQEQIDAILNEETEPTDPDFTGEAISSSKGRETCGGNIKLRNILWNTDFRP